jgi:acetyl esterase/lipase
MRMRLAVMMGLVCLAMASGAEEKYQTGFNILLWPDGKPPDAQGDDWLDKPILTAVLPPEAQRNGTSVIICPGGANVRLFHHQEGMAIAEHLNEWGVAGFVLTYRLGPRYGQSARLLDGQRAVQVVRSRAAEWKLDPQRIGMMGFSAGGGVTASTGLNVLAGDPGSPDPARRVSSRPDFAVLVYGAGGLAPAPGRAGNTSPPDPAQVKQFPPSFLVAAEDDRMSSGAVGSWQALRNAGVSAELHIYQKGRHGFGAAEFYPILSDWMGRLEAWMKYGGWLGRKQ